MAARLNKAITWFFKNEEQGIILEDDCIPTKIFSLVKFLLKDIKTTQEFCIKCK